MAICRQAVDSEKGRDQIATAASAFMTYHDVNSTKIKTEKTLDLLRDYDDFSAPILNSFFELNQIDNSVCEIVQDEILANGLGSSNPYEIRVTEISKSTSFAVLEPSKHDACWKCIRSSVSIQCKAQKPP